MEILQTNVKEIIDFIINLTNYRAKNLFKNFDWILEISNNKIKRELDNQITLLENVVQGFDKKIPESDLRLLVNEYFTFCNILMLEDYQKFGLNNNLYTYSNKLSNVIDDKLRELSYVLIIGWLDKDKKYSKFKSVGKIPIISSIPIYSEIYLLPSFSHLYELIAILKIIFSFKLRLFFLEYRKNIINNDLESYEFNKINHIEIRNEFIRSLSVYFKDEVNLKRFKNFVFGQNIDGNIIWNGHVLDFAFILFNLIELKLLNKYHLIKNVKYLKYSPIDGKYKNKEKDIDMGSYSSNVSKFNRHKEARLPSKSISDIVDNIKNKLEAKE